MQSDTSSPADDAVPLPDWARQALSAASSQPPRPSIDQLSGSPEWPLLLDAAVVSSFLPQELAPHAIAEDMRSRSEKRVLAYCEPLTTPEGTRWELRRDTRTAVLRLALDSNGLAAPLARTSERFDDAVSQALRATLSGTASEAVDSNDLAGLEALRVAASALGGLESVAPQLPVRTLDRLIRKRRLVEQFERICGQNYRTEIVGRDGELETLRAYVGVIASDTVLGNVSRAYGHARRAVAGRRPLAFWGTGGVGKTTLLSRFMLEHIDAAEHSYPFAYLDFDRPSISPQDHFGLFAEICLQVSVQFEELDDALRELRDEALAAQPGGQNADAERKLRSLVERLRERIDKYLDAQESFFEWTRPVLIVLDTFEIVQYDANQVTHLERFLRLFIDSKWPRLRLVVAGRKRVDQLVTAVEAHELQGIEIDGATQLLLRTAERASKPISSTAAHELAALLAIKRSMLAEPRVHPLRVRMIAGIFGASDEPSGEKIAASLIDELRNGLKKGGSAASSLVEGVLVRRIVAHVRDARVRALADPGLVVRRITPEVIREVMARGTPAPGSTEPEDSANFERWEVSRQEAAQIYEAFSKEGALVERDGNALRHRQDVRSEMLPLIQLRNPHRFALLHRLAFDHFKSKAAPRNKPAAAEAIYHGLWCGYPLEELDAIWTDSQLSNARIDPEEFEPDSLPTLFLKARNREGLTAEEAHRLPPSIAAAWASEFGEQFLLAEDPLEAFDIIRAATGHRLERAVGTPDLLAIAARLLYRAGAWRDAQSLAWLAAESLRQDKESSTRATRASLHRLAVHIAAKAGDRSPEVAEVSESFPLFDPPARVEVASYLMIGALRSNPGSRPAPLRRMLDSAIAELRKRKWDAPRQILRLGALASELPDPKLVLAWVEATEVFPRVPLSGRHGDELLQDVLADVLEVPDGPPLHSLDELDRLWRQQRPGIAKRLLQDGQDESSLAGLISYLMVYDHGDWNAVLANALRQTLATSPKGLLSSLRKADFVPTRAAANGPDIVGSAMWNGRFLELAHFLASLPDSSPQLTPPDGWLWPGPKPQPSAHEVGLYPQSLPALAKTLLRWHEDLLLLAGRSAGPSSQEA